MLAEGGRLCGGPDAACGGEDGLLEDSGVRGDRGGGVAIEKRRAARGPIGVACDAVEVVVHPRVVDGLVHHKRHHRLDLSLERIAQRFHRRVGGAVVELAVVKEMFVDAVGHENLELGAGVVASEKLAAFGPAAEDFLPERVVAARIAKPLPSALGVPHDHAVAARCDALALEGVVVAGPVVVFDVDADEEVVGEVHRVEVGVCGVVVRQRGRVLERVEGDIACVKECGVAIHHLADVAHVEIVRRAVVLLEHLLPDALGGVVDAFERAVDIQRGQRADGREPAHLAVHPARDFIDDERVADVILTGADAEFVVGVRVVAGDHEGVAQLAGAVVVAPLEVKGRLLRMVEPPRRFGEKVQPHVGPRVGAG